MMPDKADKGTTLTARRWNALVTAANANTVRAGSGINVTRRPGGTTVAARIDRKKELPFRVELYPGEANKVLIGTRRGDTYYPVRDVISVLDPETQAVYTIQKTTSEEVTVTAAGWIYYLIIWDGLDWTAEPLYSETWPPADDSPENVYLPLALVRWEANDTQAMEVFQLCHDAPVVTLRPYRVDFAPIYKSGGDVRIRAGRVNVDGAETAVTGLDLSLASSDYVWIEITAADGSTSYTVNGALQSGSAPVEWEYSGSTLTLRIALGRVAGGVYECFRQGKVNLGPLHTPEYPNDYTITTRNNAELAAVRDYVGITAPTDVFLKVTPCRHWFEGGLLENMTQGVEIEFGGVTASPTPNYVTSGALVGDSTLRLSTKTLTVTSERGLVQALSEAVDADIDVDLSGLVLGSDYKVAADAGDAAPGFLAAKVDDSSIEVTAGDVLAVKADGVTKTMLNANCAGTGITSAVDGSLQVNVDGQTIQVNGANNLAVLDYVSGVSSGITGAKLNPDCAGAGLVYDGTNKELDVSVEGTTVNINGSGEVYVPDDGIAQSQMVSSAFGTGLTGGSGSQISVTLSSSVPGYGKLMVSSNDSTPDYAENKITGDGTWIDTTILNEGGDEEVRIDHIGPGTTASTVTVQAGDTVTYDAKGHITGWSHPSP